MKIYAEPDSGIDPVLEFIRRSRGHLNMNYYLLDQKDVIKEIEKAVSRKVKIRIIVDGHPYGGNQGESIDALRKTGAQVNFSPSRFDGDEVFDHAKYMFNESEYMIGTANLTQDAFSKNREYLVEGSEKKVEEFRSFRNGDPEKIFFELSFCSFSIPVRLEYAHQ